MTSNKHPASNNQHSASGIRHPVSGTQDPASSTQHPASINRPFIIPVFLPHAGCPHQCVFCNQVSITGSRQSAIDPDQIRSQIHQFLQYKIEGRKPVQISFYGGNFLGLNPGDITRLLDLATDFIRRGQADSIRFSTRPDTISPENLAIVARYPVETVELGVQSMDDHVLAQTERGHRAEDTVWAVKQLKAHPFIIGLQMMVGLPGDNEVRALTTAEKIAALQPDFVRIYPTVVVRNSKLARRYQDGSYTPLSLEEAVNQVKKIYLLFKNHNLPVIRMGLQAAEELEDDSTVLAGPYHPAFGHLVYSEVFLDAAREAIESVKTLADTITIAVNTRSISKMRGLKNLNIDKLKRHYHFKSVAVVPDASLGEDELMVRYPKSQSRIRRSRN